MFGNAPTIEQKIIKAATFDVRNWYYAAVFEDQEAELEELRRNTEPPHYWHFGKILPGYHEYEDQIIHDRKVNMLLLGIPLPQYFHDPSRNLDLRDFFHDAIGGWIEPRIMHQNAHCAWSTAVAVMDTLVEFGRAKVVYQIYSNRTGRSLMLSAIKPDFSKNGIWRVKDTLGTWHRYHEDKVYVEINWRIKKRYRQE